MLAKIKHCVALKFLNYLWTSHPDVLLIMQVLSEVCVHMYVHMHLHVHTTTHRVRVQEKWSMKSYRIRKS